MLRPTFAFSIDISSETFMYMFESSNPYKYAVTTSIKCKTRCFCVARDIRYWKVIPFITGEYVLLKLISGLCVNPCATSICLISHNLIVLIPFPNKNPLEPDRMILGGVGITLLNTSLFLSESSSVSIAFFHLIQYERCLQSAMVLGSGSLRRSVTMVETYELTIVVVWSNNSHELV
jgi:hypothetical protein